MTNKHSNYPMATSSVKHVSGLCKGINYGHDLLQHTSGGITSRICCVQCPLYIFVVSRKVKQWPMPTVHCPPDAR